MKLFDLFNEEIKGWKHAGRDISAMRHQQAQNAKSVKLVKLKNDGSESKMHDASSMYSTEDEAKAHHDRILQLNPTRVIRHNMYVDGKFVAKLDGPSHDIEEVYPGQSSGRLKNYVS